MKTILLFLLFLCISKSEVTTHYIAKNIPSEASNSMKFNDEGYSDISSWTFKKEQEPITLSFETKQTLHFLANEVLYYAWCTNHKEYILVAVHDIHYEYWRYNPKFINLKFK